MEPSRRRPTLFALAAITVLIVTSCSQGNYPLPDRNSAESKSAVKEITAILESYDDIAGEDATCRVSYLGSEDGSRFAWGHCTGTHQGADFQTSVSTIFRITGDHAEWPSDATYVEDVQEMFPPRLADDALNNPNRLKP